MADPNTLYSTIVQSTAAIVAIVAGFLTATVVNMSATRRALTEEIANQASNRDIAERFRHEALNKHERLHASHRIDDNLEAIVNFERPLPNADDAFDRLRDDDIDRHAFELEWDETRREIERVEGEVREKIAAYGLTHGLFDQWREAHGIEFAPRDERYAERLFYLAAYPPEEDDPPARLNRSTSNSARWRLPPDPAVRTEQMAYDREREAARDAELREKIRDMDEAERRVVQCNAAIDLLEHQLRTARTPPRDLWVGAFALLFLSVCGLFFPLMLMPQTAENYDPTQKAWAIGLFAVGLLIVFLYVLALVLPDKVGAAWHLAQRTGAKIARRAARRT